ncbi:MAG: DNA primase [Paracoccaceae bacterium]|jgi:DNA primase|nr:DNA primase [Paracoccaceae bacterium]MDE2632532.1 DNA primase [Paracoccaceae bacterium]
MSLPPGFLDDLRTRTSLSQVVGRKVMWDTRKSNQAKGDMWAPCPFHQEKSASFHVDDSKGFYYCFGCHAKGDAISFIRETENVGFIEAIEILAQEAGMPVPKRDPHAQEKSEQRSELTDVMEQAVQFYRLQLKTAPASEARAYLARRGLSEAIQDRFDMGFAPDVRQGLLQHLTAKGVTPDQLVAAGLCARPEDGGAPYDRFRGRILFPIRDARGRCIALGGRSLDPNARAKYLNSPETVLFDKGRNLYHLKPAREAAGKGQPLIVAEGYMDVIALVEAGFGAAVAPLGTAVTEHQLALLWRIAPEPIIALDGDTAGLRAAYRVIDLALPLLEAGQSLRFAVMPEGQDPDDVIRAGGPSALQTLLDKAMPMVDLLWQREIQGKVFDSPERRAMLDKGLREKIAMIRDPSIRSHYGSAIKELRWALFGTGRQQLWSGQWGKKVKIDALSTTKQSALAQAADHVPGRLREAVILAALVKAPALVAEFQEPLESLACSDPRHRQIQTILLSQTVAPAEKMLGAIEAAFGSSELQGFLAQSHVAVVPCIQRSDDLDLTRLTLREEFAKLDARLGLAAEIEEAAEDIASLSDETLTWRLKEAASAQESATLSVHKDTAEYDLAENGARINRDERRAFEALMTQITRVKSS